MTDSQTGSTPDRIARAIVRGLYEGTFVPGQRLVEPDLMTQFSASRSAVREAIRRLEAEGVLDVLPYRGAQIRRLSEREAREALLVIEYCTGLAARLAAERIQEPGKREEFQTALDSVLAAQHLPDGFEQIRARNRFYRAVAQCAGNRDLQRFIASVQVHLVRTHPIRPAGERFAGYARIAEAILAGCPEEAEAACRAHMRPASESAVSA